MDERLRSARTGASPNLDGVSAAQTQTTLPTGAFEGIVAVRHEIFRSPEDGYAVLEVVGEESGEEFTVTGPVGHLRPGERAELRGEWQEHSRYGPQVRALGARPLDPADREGQIAYLTSLRHIGPARAERLRDELRGRGPGRDRRRPRGDVPGAERRQRAPGRGRGGVLAREPRRARPPRPPRPPRARPPGGADPRPLRRRGDAGPARGPLHADRGGRGRLRPRRRDRSGRRRAARTPTAAPRRPPPTSSARPSARATPTCRPPSCAAAPPSCSGPTPTPTSSPAPPACCWRKVASTASRPTPRSCAAPRPCSPGPAPPR